MYRYEYRIADGPWQAIDRPCEGYWPELHEEMKHIIEHVCEVVTTTKLIFQAQQGLVGKEVLVRLHIFGDPPVSITAVDENLDPRLRATRQRSRSSRSARTRSTPITTNSRSRPR